MVHRQPNRIAAATLPAGHARCGLSRASCPPTRFERCDVRCWPSKRRKRTGVARAPPSPRASPAWRDLPHAHARRRDLGVAKSRHAADAARRSLLKSTYPPSASTPKLIPFGPRYRNLRGAAPARADGGTAMGALAGARLSTSLRAPAVPTFSTAPCTSPACGDNAMLASWPIPPAFQHAYRIAPCARPAPLRGRAESVDAA
jgi:hypothetical protein